MEDPTGGIATFHYKLSGWLESKGIASVPSSLVKTDSNQFRWCEGGLEGEVECMLVCA